ncbi:MAG: carbonic anhydrase family protein [Desulfobacterales bacterium]|nr:carbonic anhydrase family protein [Desulfobacterales bacterium]
MKFCNFLLLFTVSGLLFTPALASEKSHWGYSGDEGPKHWGELNSKYSACSTGKNQSPVNLKGMVESKLSPVVIKYRAGGNVVVNNGHTIQVNYKPGNNITLNDHTYELKQFHFHSPSENTIEGRSYPMEAHFVHLDKVGNIAVIAVMFKEGEKNAELEKAWVHMPSHANIKSSLPVSVDANRILPEDHSYYRFNGSLTTPPCSEGVLWIVMKSFSIASKKQINKFTRTMHHPNNRPVQPLNARIILK